MPIAAAIAEQHAQIAHRDQASRAAWLTCLRDGSQALRGRFAHGAVR
jgi:hypothetical protein